MKTKDTKAKELIHRLLNKANIQINGDHPWDIQVHNEHFYWRVLRCGSLGLGESYMDGWWDCTQLDEFIARLLRAQLDRKITHRFHNLILQFINRLINFQTRRRALKVGRMHYDLGNDFYQLMLDKTLSYSCAYWPTALDLDQAQKNKLELICKKLELQKGMTLLDIGCGFGGLAEYAARNYGVEVLGITVSQQQEELARQRCQGLPITIKFQDYRDLKGSFDRIVSVGMFEHVGFKNYDSYMQVVNRCLKSDGLFLLHCIGSNRTTFVPDPWILKYIFPNSILPSIQQIAAASESLFVMEDWHNFGADYDKTLMAWYHNFKNNWPAVAAQFGERFYRMWTYYLLSCAGAFRAREVELWQVVFSKFGMMGGYASYR
jgi:cyclopropane-fatty-acyl-phospholipid synthase